MRVGVCMHCRYLKGFGDHRCVLERIPYELAVNRQFGDEQTTLKDIGNRELLAVRLALGEWRHWLEGAAQPFLVWTDHKNVEHIRSAKSLNARQARWALFFGQLIFSLLYRPGSKNTKPDALSHLFKGPGRDVAPNTILPKGVVEGSLPWNVEQRVREAVRRGRPQRG